MHYNNYVTRQKKHWPIDKRRVSNEKETRIESTENNIIMEINKDIYEILTPI